MQKLITIYLDTHAYMGGNWLKTSNADRHGVPEEHLQQYLSEGWRVISLSGFGGSEGLIARGWMAVVLEK